EQFGHFPVEPDARVRVDGRDDQLARIPSREMLAKIEYGRPPRGEGARDLGRDRPGPLDGEQRRKHHDDEARTARVRVVGEAVDGAFVLSPDAVVRVAPLEKI